jgi:hypothetical protein
MPRSVLGAEVNVISLSLSLKKIEVPVLLGLAKLGPCVVVYMYSLPPNSQNKFPSHVLRSRTNFNFD